MSSYAAFLAQKAASVSLSGIADVPPLNDSLFPHQKKGVEFALRLGRSAMFYDTGLGKTAAQLEWARIVAAHTGKPVLILAPLAVAAQTVREGVRFGIAVTYAREAENIRSGINITNYDRLDKFDPSMFAGIVLDESGILKSFTGKTRIALVNAFAGTPFRLCCTATPAPNDHAELGNHAAFLGIMDMREMLSKFFINDTSTASQEWRLKGHAVKPFWEWVSSWAICCGKPSDLGFSDDGFALPPIDYHRHVVATDRTIERGENLFRIPEMSATSMHREKRLSANARADLIAGLVNRNGETWIVWCDTNNEADALTARIPDAMEVRGNMDADEKEGRIIKFCEGGARVLITKPSIAGHGLNLQHCANMAFIGLSFSYEAFYQAVRRIWRFGQTRPCN